MSRRLSPVGDESAFQDLTEVQLLEWGRQLGEQLVAPSALAISGDLGAGKTTLARGICLGYGVEQPVTSPTFALINKYESPQGPVFHIDLYRLAGERDVADLGLLELFSENAVVLVEWPERAAGILPARALQIHLEHVAHSPQMRRIRAAL